MSTTSSISPVPSLHPPQDPNLITSARRALEASILNTGSQLDSDLKSRAATLHANNAALEKQQKELNAAVKSFAKENDKLKKVADDAARKVKELGNVQNWAEVCEREFLVLEETIRLADGGSEGSDGGYEICEVCDRDLADVEEENVLWCKSCDGLWHLGCLGLVSKPEGEWICVKCRKRGKKINGAGSKGKEQEKGNEVADVAMNDGPEHSEGDTTANGVEGGTLANSKTADQKSVDSGEQNGVYN